jgi:proline-specific peptidase
MPSGQEGYISVPGGNIWYRILGEEQPGLPLVVLHGGPGFPHDYLEPLAALSDERPVIFYDQLGCGNSDTPADPALWTLGRFVDELEQIIQAFKWGKYHLLGQSWGSMLAVDFLLTKNPSGVASLILSGPCLSVTRFIADQRAYLLEFPQDMQKIIQETEVSGDFQSPAYQEAMLAYYQRHVCRLDPWPDCLQRSMAKMGRPVYEQMWGPSEFTLTGNLQDYERTAQLKDIAVPVLFTCGRYDEATPSSTALYQDQLPHSEMVIFEDASHEHHLEKNELYSKIGRDFLSRAENNERNTC